MAGYLHRWFSRADHSLPSLIILEMDTPGGLSQAMRSIIRDILRSPVPVVGYVAPSGARAASAGTYILYACSIAAMAEGTNVGSATPVPIGGSIPFFPEPPKKDRPAPGKSPEGTGDVEERKIMNDAVAYIRSLAEMNGRNPDWAEKAVLSAANLSAREALNQHVIDLIAPTVPDLLKQIEGRSVRLQGQQRTIHLLAAEIRTIRPEWKDRLLEVLSRPDLAYFFFLLGIVALAFEFSHPGFVLPGITGLLALILAFFAFMVLPVNIAGVLLLLLGITLMISEVLIGSFGVLGIAGVVSFFLGSLFFYHTSPGTTEFSGHPDLAIILLLTFLVSGFFLGVLRIALKARLRPVLTGDKTLIGERATAMEPFQKKGRVKLHSEIWWATSPAPVDEGQEVVIEALSGLTLFVRPVSEEEK
jgi:membrane-bound serine protease (ClpP class)